MRRITEAERRNFETLQQAFEYEDVALMVVTEDATGLERVALCAVSFDGEEYAFTPFALMIDGNPYEQLTPPEEVEA